MRDVLAVKKIATPPPVNVVISLSVRWDQNDLQCETREGRTDRVPLFSQLDNRTESESQDSAAKPGSPWQWPQLFLAIHAPQSTLSANAKNQPYQSTMGRISDQLTKLIEQMKESDRRFQKATDEFLAKAREHTERLEELSKD